jgi:hypothetical protein
MTWNSQVNVDGHINCLIVSFLELAPHGLKEANFVDKMDEGRKLM